MRGVSGPAPGVRIYPFTAVLEYLLNRTLSYRDVVSWLGKEGPIMSGKPPAKRKQPEPPDAPAPHASQRMVAAHVLARTSSNEGVIGFLRRGVRVEVLRWLLDHLTSLGMPAGTTTHDVVHGLQTKWTQATADASEFGFGYGLPTTGWAVRGQTAATKRSWIEHVAACSEDEPTRLRAELEGLFGVPSVQHDEGWFGKATVFVSHAWERSFSSVVEAVEAHYATMKKEGGAAAKEPHFFLDILAINQHGDDKLARASMVHDLQHLQVISCSLLIAFRCRGVVHHLLMTRDHQ